MKVTITSIISTKIPICITSSRLCPTKDSHYHMVKIVILESISIRVIVVLALSTDDSVDFKANIIFILTTKRII